MRRRGRRRVVNDRALVQSQYFCDVCNLASIKAKWGAVLLCKKHFNDPLADKVAILRDARDALSGLAL